MEQAQKAERPSGECSFNMRADLGLPPLRKILITPYGRQEVYDLKESLTIQRSVLWLPFRPIKGLDRKYMKISEAWLKVGGCLQDLFFFFFFFFFFH